MYDDRKFFEEERNKNIDCLSKNSSLQQFSKEWYVLASNYKYSYNFDWLGLPIIQFPQDIVAIQEIIWRTQPEVIIETGIARGGSLILSASILHLLNKNGKVIGIDIDIRDHNRKAIEAHPLSFRIQMIEGSSIESSVFNTVKNSIQNASRVMVILDSNHTHEHVFEELKLYSHLVSKGCYLVVMDTIIADMPKDYYPNRPWSLENNPKTALEEFLKITNNFTIDTSIHNKLSISSSPGGYLKCIK